MKYLISLLFFFLTLFWVNVTFSHSEEIEQGIQDLVKRYDLISPTKQLVVREKFIELAHQNKQNEKINKLIWNVLSRLRVQTSDGKKRVRYDLVKLFPPLTKKNIVPTWVSLSMPEEWTSSNMIVLESKWATVIDWSNNFDWNSEFVYNKLISDVYDIDVTLWLRTDIGYIEVYHVNTNSLDSFPIEDGHILNYRIGKDLKNVIRGLNTYIVRGYTPNKVFHHVLEINVVDMSESLFWEELVVVSKKESHRQLAFNACSDYEGKDFQDCYNQVNIDYTITKNEACEFGDGFHEYNIDVYRPEKEASTRDFFKSWNDLFYTVDVSMPPFSNWKFPSCEDKDIELYVYSYDCGTQKTRQVMNNNVDIDNLWKCWLDIRAAYEENLLVKRRFRECYNCSWFEWFEYVDIETWEKEKVDIMNFDGIVRLKEIDSLLMERYLWEKWNPWDFLLWYSISDFDASWNAVITKNMYLHWLTSESYKSVQYKVDIDLVERKFMF